MKKTHYILLILIALFQFSCFEIVEDVTIKPDGSGKLKYILNFSQSTTKIKSLLLLEEVEGHKVPSKVKIQEEFKKACEMTKQVKGISSVHYVSDFENFIFTYTCDFEKVENLNAIIDKFARTKDDLKTYKSDAFAYSKSTKTYTRKGDVMFSDYYAKVKKSKDVVLDGAKYTSVTRFENEVKNVSNENVLVSKNKKAVLHKIDFVHLAKNGEIINKNIQLK